jgi:hypothetical protein
VPHQRYGLGRQSEAYERAPDRLEWWAQPRGRARENYSSAAHVNRMSEYDAHAFDDAATSLTTRGWTHRSMRRQAVVISVAGVPDGWAAFRARFPARSAATHVGSRTSVRSAVSAGSVCPVGGVCVAGDTRDAGRSVPSARRGTRKRNERRNHHATHSPRSAIVMFNSFQVA